MSPADDAQLTPPVEERHSPSQSSGPTVGIIIIFILMMFGALYFWSEITKRPQPESLPLIPGTPSQQ
jgi:hypothetical protein